ncbi:MAG: ROK family transcriptional regulator [Oscillibacter sp.]|nr:ROK family transcriptional regulator [Oscillibacter sp.]
MELRSGINNDTLRCRNRGLVLKLLAADGPLTRVELARRTQLSKMSVSNIIAEFLDQGIAEEREPLAVQGQGRNPIVVDLSPRAPKLIGLYIFRDQCAAVLCDLRLHTLREARSPMTGDTTIRLTETLFRLIDQVLPPPGDTILGIGVGSIGPLDLRNGLILTPPNFFNIHDLPIVRLLKERYHLPVELNGQYDCAALAEKYFGAARAFQDFLFVGINSGIGSGIVSGGELLRTAAGFTSELGHTSIDWRGNPCSCGNRGCLETYAGIQVILPRLRALTGQDLSFQDFCRMAEADPASPVWPVLEEMTRALGYALTSAVNLLDPQAILIGHEGHFLPDRCLTALEEQIERQRLASDRTRVQILRSAFGRDAQIRGCACGFLHRVFTGEFFS